VDTWRVGSNKFMTAVKVQSNRTDNLEKLIDLERGSTMQLYNRMARIYSDENNINDIFSKTHSKVMNMVYRLSDVDSLAISLQTLLNGNLPSELISHLDIEIGLSHLRHYLDRHHSHLRILYTNPKMYYVKSHFAVVRRTQTLFIILDCPLTTISNPLTVFRLEKNPLLTTGTKRLGYHT
jgi:hypothetical protein